jgi:hypothetical protein
MSSDTRLSITKGHSMKLGFLLVHRDRTIGVRVHKVVFILVSWGQRSGRPRLSNDKTASQMTAKVAV